MPPDSFFLLLGLLSSHLVALPSLIMKVFALSRCVFFCPVGPFTPGGLLFFEEKTWGGG